MDVLRLLHFADLHLGVEAGGRPNPDTGLNQRVHDVCDRLDELCEAAEAEGVHAVLFAGDAFKNQHPSPTLQSLFAARVRRLARSGIGVFLLIGNHDLPRMGGLAHTFSIYEALEVEGVVVGDRARVYRLGLRGDTPAAELQVAALPHFSRHQVLARLPEDASEAERLIADRLESTIRDLRSDLDPEFPAVFCGHCQVSQAEVGTGAPRFDASEVEVSLSTLSSGGRFAYYALGHLHRHQVLASDPPVVYSGALERVDFGEGSRVDVAEDGVRVREADPKGFVRVDLVRDGAEWRPAGPPVLHPVAARPFVTIRAGNLDDEDPTAALAGRLDSVRGAGVDLAGAFVKVTGTSSERSRVSRRLVRRMVEEAYDVQLALDVPSGRMAVRDPRFGRRMAEVEALERYLETQTDAGAEADELLRLGRDLIAEVLG